MKKALIGACVALIVLASCATVPPAQQDERVIELIDLLNTLPPREFAAYAAVPFLFGEQVLYAQNDVVAVLGRLQENGLIVAPQIVGSRAELGVPGEARFDVGVFYDRLPPDARAVVTESNAGIVTLLVGAEAQGLPKLIGIVRGRP
jgi:hypothetical protein